MELNDFWRQWIAESLLRGFSHESILLTLNKRGFDSQHSTTAIVDMEAEPAFKAARRCQQLHRKLESVVGHVQRTIEASSPRHAQVEKRTSPSREEFVERYVMGSRPVVLTDVTRDWKAMERWSPAAFKDRFGHLDVEIQAERNADRRFDENHHKHSQTVRLGDFVDRVLSGDSTNDYYLVANNHLLRRPEFAPLLADVGSLPAFCNPKTLAEAPDRASLWLGPAGTVTALHHDTVMLFHTQIVGRKRWRFVSPLETPKLYNYVQFWSAVNIDKPDLDKFPLFKEVTVLDVVVEPGETIFLPMAWWHVVNSLDVSISLSYNNVDAPNGLQFFDPTLHDWLEWE